MLSRALTGLFQFHYSASSKSSFLIKREGISPLILNLRCFCWNIFFINFAHPLYPIVSEKMLSCKKISRNFTFKLTKYLPAFDKWHIKCTSGSSRPHVERPRGPQQRDAVGRVVTVQRTLQKERLNIFTKFKFLLVFRQKIDFGVGDRVTVRDGVDEGVKVESRQVGVLGLDEHYVGSMIPRK